MAELPLNKMATQNIQTRTAYVKALAKGKGENYDLHLRMLYHTEPDATLRAEVWDELQRRGALPQAPDLRDDQLVYRSVTREEALTLPNLFVLNPANTKYLNGAMPRISARSSGFFGSAVLLLIFAIFFGASFAYDYLTLKRLGESGATVQAKVTDLTLVRNKKNPNREYASYQFTGADGQPHNAKGEISKADYIRLKIGDPIEIVYLPNDPTVSRIKATEMAFNPTTMFGAGLFGGLALICLAMANSERKNHRRLDDTGQLLLAQIVETANLRSKGGNNLSIGYACRLPDGEVLWGLDSFPRNDLKGQPSPSAGTPVILKYADAKHYQLL